MKFLDKLLDYYNLDIKEYEDITKKVTLSDLPLFTCFKNIDSVTNLILDKIKNNKKILVYGDYDADGVLATSILVYTLRKLNANCSYYVPSRYLDTYGLTVDKVRIAKEKGFDLIITVDNGVTCIDSINLCKELGLDIIITDHHEYNEPFVTDLFLHPKESELSITTSGAAVSFYLSYSLLKEADPYLLTLAGISIISDMMPMKGENRKIVKLALEFLNKYKYRQITILSGCYSFDEKTLSMNLISKINAVGRVCENKEINNLVKYFISEDFKTLYFLRDKFNIINDKKKILIKESTNNIKVDEDNVLSSITIKADVILGLGGLLANKFLSKYNLPTAVFVEDKGDLKGSIRSKNGCNLIPFLNENKDLFKECGGHKHASGITIDISKFEDFKTRFNKYCENNKFKKEESPIDILLNEINLDNYEILNSFSPFGESFEEPLFLLHDIDIDSYTLLGKNKEHLKISKDGVTIIWFNYNKEILNNINSINLYGRIKLITFKNNKELQFQVVDF